MLVLRLLLFQLVCHLRPQKHEQVAMGRCTSNLEAEGLPERIAHCCLFILYAKSRSFPATPQNWHAGAEIYFEFTALSRVFLGKEAFQRFPHRCRLHHHEESVQFIG